VVEHLIKFAREFFSELAKFNEDYTLSAELAH
jgi:hypothetical protein